MTRKKVIIIGAGIGGLATAALLAKDGFDVTIVEKNKEIGGRAFVWNKKGFRFDMGPSWYTMPDVFEWFFGLFNKKPSDYYSLKRLDPHYRVIFGRKDYVDVSASTKKNLDMFETMEPGARTRIREFLNVSEKLYEDSKPFMYTYFNSFLDFLKPSMWGKRLNVPPFKKLDAFIAQYTSNDRIKKILSYTMVFLGGSPHNTPALYAIMSHIDFNLGIFFPKEGIIAIPNALKSLCVENNVKILTNEPVKQILVTNGVAIGVRTNKRTIYADIVVSNADYPFTEMSMLDSKWRSLPESYWKKRTLAPSAFIMHIGLKGKIKNLKHHSLFFAHDWEKHFNEIFSHPTWPDKPSYYICCPSKTSPDAAPKGDENLFVLVPIASGLKDTAAQRKKYENKILDHIEHVLDEEIRSRIYVKRIFTLNDFKETFNAYQGTALGLSHTIKQSIFMRPQNKSKKVKNLYFVGQYTQPGIGMPICLISAKQVQDRIKRDEKQ